MTPYTHGDRVVCHYPDARPFVGTVTHVHNCGDLTVTDGDGFFRAAVSEVRPAMPRGKRDIKEYGPYWWRDGRVVDVSADFRRGRMTVWSHGVLTWTGLCPKSAWAGPVAPAPLVRP